HIGAVRARQARAGEAVPTPAGAVTARAGDWLVDDAGVLRLMSGVDVARRYLSNGPAAHE
ncbi:MAG: hypothetical protein QM662_14980, partial [Gordonia sp. (in: high G+C Gram-positive bacteria)]